MVLSFFVYELVSIIVPSLRQIRYTCVASCEYEFKAKIAKYNCKKTLIHNINIFFMVALIQFVVLKKVK
jgi:hypothetical protein